MESFKNTKIKTVEFEAFRGFPGNCRIDLDGQSLIIYGENGSGKSSIVDAIEFNLQGRIDKSIVINHSLRPLATNLSSKNPGSACTKITMDGKTNIRSIKADNEKYEAEPSGMHPNFSYTPFVLRRGDITLYNATPENQKLILLLNYVYSKKSKLLLDNDPLMLELYASIEQYDSEISNIINQLQYYSGIEQSDLEAHAFDINDYLDSIYYVRGRKNGKKDTREMIDACTFDFLHELGTRLIDLLKLRANSIEKVDEYSTVTTSKLKPLEKYYQPVGDYLTDSFKKITNADYIKKITLAHEASNASLRIDVALQNDRVVSASEIFSEANNDLMVLLLYLAMIRVGVGEDKEKIFKQQKECLTEKLSNESPEKKKSLRAFSTIRRGLAQSKLLILDDVLQSVDGTIRNKFICYVLEEFNDWQIIVTCHDRLWLSQLSTTFTNYNHPFKECYLQNWIFTAGPSITIKGLKGVDESLQHALDTNDVNVIAPVAGRLLEKICQKLSVSLSCEIRRKEDDKYTIGDLWNSISKKMRDYQSLKDLICSINQYKEMRNLKCCHYNEWAESYTDSEVIEFAHLIQKLYERVYCKNCNSWLSISETEMHCCCYQLKYTK